MQLSLPLPDLLLSDETLRVPRPARVYVNRSLRFDRVPMVGFDMDYTLVIYRQQEMDRLSIEATARKLVADLGYPEELLSMPIRPDFAIRGLHIDKKLGNILKMDRHRYVKRAYHGMQELSRERRHQLYHRRAIRPGSSRYHWIDTLFGLSEVAVYSAAIEVLDRLHREAGGAGGAAEGGEGGPDYDQLFEDVRRSIDLSHQDGSIKDAIVADPASFLIRDPELGPTLHKLRSAGKKLFLLTNSKADYTERLMGYLLDGALSEYPSWRNYFDIIITDAQKPAFFVSTDRAFAPAEEGLPPPREGFVRGRLYQGGCLARFHERIPYEGDQILYVGDHIYGDVLRAKKESAWRTAMIVQEMHHELEVLAELEGALARDRALTRAHAAVTDELRFRQRRLKDLTRGLRGDLREDPEEGEEARARMADRVRQKRAIERVRGQRRAIEEELNELEDGIERAYHPYWGPIFKAGSEVSSFGAQVERYACVYTDRVSNLNHYSPVHYFRRPRHRMPHEL